MEIAMLPKVVWSRSNRVIPFSHLRMTDTFAWDAQVFVVVEPCKNKYDEVVNCLNLQNGLHYLIEPERMVTPVNITITVED
jgi:hypothetical protein